MMDGILYFYDETKILESISNVTEVDKAEILRFISEFDQNKVKDYSDSPRLHLWNGFRSQFNPLTKIKDTCYFHGCRCYSKADFNDGLLPNHLAIEKIWENLWSIFQTHLPYNTCEEFRRIFEDSDKSRRAGGYWWRIRNDQPRQHGPWGKLVREEWFLPFSHSNHYLEHGPEIVKLIINHLEDKYSGEFLQIFIQETEPCIVHFLSGKQNPIKIGHGLKWLLDTSDCVDENDFDYYGLESMEGRVVEKGKILEVEILEDSNNP